MENEHKNTILEIVITNSCYISGFIGKITLQIPLSRLHSEPWVISIEKLYLVAGPLQDFKVRNVKNLNSLIRNALINCTCWRFKQYVL